MKTKTFVDEIKKSKLAELDNVEIDKYDVRIFVSSISKLSELIKILSIVQEYADAGYLGTDYYMWHNIGYYNNIDDCILEVRIKDK